MKKEFNLEIIPDDVGLPSFFIDYYLGKCREKIKDWYDDFLLHFTTPFENYWVEYVKVNYETYLKDQTWPEIANFELF